MVDVAEDNLFDEQQEQVDDLEENIPEGGSEEDNVNDIATSYIIPVSVIVGFLLATITICCVCYRRWRFAIRNKQ